jgi:CRP-like cAMP-binding protein
MVDPIPILIDYLSSNKEILNLLYNTHDTLEENVSDYSALLKTIDLFLGLSDHQLERINSLCRKTKYQKYDIIFHENSRETELYIVLDGEIGILVDPSTVSPEPRSGVDKEMIAVVHEGEIFGEMALADEGIRSASARSLQNDTGVLVIERKPLLDLCKQDPDLGFKIMFNLCNALALKIRTVNLQLREALLKNKK